MFCLFGVCFGVFVGRCSILWLRLPILDPRQLFGCGVPGREWPELTQGNAHGLEGKAERDRGKELEGGAHSKGRSLKKSIFSYLLITLSVSVFFSFFLCALRKTDFILLKYESDLSSPTSFILVYEH